MIGIPGGSPWVHFSVPDFRPLQPALLGPKIHFLRPKRQKSSNHGLIPYLFPFFAAEAANHSIISGAEYTLLGTVLYYHHGSQNQPKSIFLGRIKRPLVRSGRIGRYKGLPPLRAHTSPETWVKKVQKWKFLGKLFNVRFFLYK